MESLLVVEQRTSFFILQGFLRGSGSVPLHSTCVLGTWGRFRPGLPRTCCGRYCQSIGRGSRRLGPSSHCMPKARAVFRFSEIGQRAEPEGKALDLLVSFSSCSHL